MFRVYTWDAHLGFSLSTWRTSALGGPGDFLVGCPMSHGRHSDYSFQIQMATHRMHRKGSVERHTSILLNSCWSSVKCSSSVCLTVIFFPTCPKKHPGFISTSNGPLSFQIKHVSKHCFLYCRLHQSPPRSRCFCLVVLLVTFWLLWWVTW